MKASMDATFNRFADKEEMAMAYNPVTNNSVPASHFGWTKEDQKDWDDFNYKLASGALEKDPTYGENLHVPGAKADAAKVRPELVFRGFALALEQVAEVATYGANKYSEDGWEKVPNGFQRYEDAQLRHALKRWQGEEVDRESYFYHLAHECWNCLAKFELYLRESDGE